MEGCQWCSAPATGTDTTSQPRGADYPPACDEHRYEYRGVFMYRVGSGTAIGCLHSEPLPGVRREYVFGGGQ